ncbi:MAG: hypothetical protein GX894_08750, partial [Clostridia bacterium]|nr:hypothetical protein [Clostridia bacterium]
MALAFWLVFTFGPVPADGSNPPGEEITVHFYAGDPEGDDYGPGSYIYPSDPAFAPYEGLFDLLAFRV